MDTDVGRMSREQLVAEVKKLRWGIREHLTREAPLWAGSRSQLRVGM